MPSPTKTLLLTLTALFLIAAVADSASQSSTARSSCLRSCHICQQMYGRHFRGHLCAHTCVRLRGRVAPDCADLASIAPYLEVANFLEAVEDEEDEDVY